MKRSNFLASRGVGMALHKQCKLCSACYIVLTRCPAVNTGHSIHNVRLLELHFLSAVQPVSHNGDHFAASGLPVAGGAVSTSAGGPRRW